MNYEKEDTCNMGIFFSYNHFSAVLSCLSPVWFVNLFGFLCRCSHYRRRCRIRAPCCNEVFDCRHCHNEAKVSYYSPSYFRKQCKFVMPIIFKFLLLGHYLLGVQWNGINYVFPIFVLRDNVIHSSFTYPVTTPCGIRNAAHKCVTIYVQWHVFGRMILRF